MNIGNTVIAAPFAFWFISYVRKLLNTEQTLPHLDKWIKLSWAVLFGIIAALDAIWNTEDLYWEAVVAVVVAVAYLLRQYRPARTLLLACIPFLVLQNIAIGIERAAPKFYKANDEYFSSAVAFSIIWLVAFAIVASRQKKTLEAERLEREREIEKRQAVEVQRNELEYLVNQRTAEITQQKEELERTLAELRETQTQLVHSEKMASLGELTAGIAHEIQNPLNFVNNFSEVSIELIDELNEEQHRPDRDTELEAEILNDLKQNLQKINHHGGRASSIVKGMLQHSRVGNGQREAIDINDLIDEYLRLAYHGFRAKDKTFNATFQTDLDRSLGKISVVPQDLGRVLLNLFTNAFYAVQQKQKEQTETQSETAYQPTVIVSTRCANDHAEITIRDNGTGVPEELLQKIFQPFFTTKPTGQGTGLGLSLAFDIITKGHSGTIDVSSKEGEGTTFVIALPA